MKLPIPDAALARHIAVLGETGSGKTHDTKAIVEHLVATGYRVCVLDTIKSDWWGMISSASGKRAGLPFRIIGGPRGHVPLHPGAGKPIGELVAKGALPLSIIDMADFEAGEPQQFFEEFARALWRNIKGVLYLVIEETHEIAPKERAGFGKENMAVYWAKKLATGSRTKGIRLIIASQRTQAVHNALLGSCGTMIAHSLSLPADQKPVRDWLDANILDKSLNATIKDELAFLPTGTAWVCCAKERFFQKIAFPEIATFDNTATPDKDAADIEVATAAVDPDELRAIIGDAVKEAEANDPKVLKKQIAELNRLLQVKVPTVSVVDQTSVIRARNEGRAEGEKAAMSSITDQMFRRDRQIAEIIRKLAGEVQTVLGHPISLPELTYKASAPVAQRIERPVPDRKAAGSSPAGRTNGANGPLKDSLQRVVNAIGWWSKIGQNPVRRERAAVVAGYSPRASTFGVYVAELVKMGLVTVAPGTVALTDAGFDVAEIPPAATRDELFDMARGLLKPQEAKLFEIVYSAHPNAISRDDIAQRMGLSPTASTTGVYIAGVAAYGIIETASRGCMRAADWLFP